MLRLILILGVAVAAWSAEPLTFDHKLHGSLRQPCESCHSGAKASERAGLPAAAKCETCHPGKGMKPPTDSATRLRDFVFFSHARHSEAKVSCSGCHGEVYINSTVVKQLTMKSCVDCHKINKATVACSSCHELGQ